MTGARSKHRLSPLTIFLLKAGVIYAGWNLLYDNILLPDGRLDTFLNLLGVRLADGTLSILGWEMESTGRVIAIFGTRGVEIQNGCNGLHILGLYAGFIIAYPGPMRKRLLFLASGILLLYIANVFRIAVFALSIAYLPDYWAVVHGYSSYVFFYSLVLSLWYLWTIISDQQTILSGDGFFSA